MIFVYLCLAVWNIVLAGSWFDRVLKEDRKIMSLCLVIVDVACAVYFLWSALEGI